MGCCQSQKQRYQIRVNDGSDDEDKEKGGAIQAIQANEQQNPQQQRLLTNDEMISHILNNGTMVNKQSISLEKSNKHNNAYNRLNNVKDNNVDIDQDVLHANAKIVQKWLITVGLPQYFGLFISNGYDSMAIVKSMESKLDLKEIGISLKGHQTKIWSEIKKLKNADISDMDHDAKHSEYKSVSNPDIDQFEFICKSNDIKQCKIVNRLLELMLKYERWNEIEDGIIKWKSIKNIWNNSYSLVEQLDDYHHFNTDHPSNYINIEYIKNTFIDYKCNNDHIMDQINMNRESLKKNINKYSIKISDINRLEMLDKMHNFIMHQYQDNHITPKSCSTYIISKTD